MTMATATMSLAVNDVTRAVIHRMSTIKYQQSGHDGCSWLRTRVYCIYQYVY